MLSNAGATLHTLGWAGPALAYYDRAIEAASHADSDAARASTLINVASIHSEALGAHQRAEELYAEAALAQARAERIALEAGDQPGGPGTGRDGPAELAEIAERQVALQDPSGAATTLLRLAEAVVQRLRACCRPDDIVARWGGEEFLVGCRQVDLAQAGEVAERLRRAAAGAATAGGEAEALSVSVGFASFPFFPGATVPGQWQDAVALADRALYAAKHGGRDAWFGLWGTPGRGADVAAVLEDPEGHAARGDVTVVASRIPVHWQPPAP